MDNTPIPTIQKTFWRDGEEYAINPETGKEYKLFPDPFQIPHLAVLKKEAETVTVGTVMYWKLRCRYLEKTIDETYGNRERDNCRVLYMILQKREI